MTEFITPINKMSAYIDTLNFESARHIYEVLQAEGSTYRVFNEKNTISANPNDFTIDSRFIGFDNDSHHQVSSLRMWVLKLAEFATDASVEELNIEQVAIGVAALFAQRDIDRVLVASYDQLNESVRTAINNG